MKKIGEADYAGPSNKSSKKKEVKKRVSSSVVNLNECGTCQKNVELNESQIECSMCIAKFHTGCLENDINMDLIMGLNLMSQWECGQCKACHNCKTTENEKSIIICEMCDRAYHIQCLEPPLSKVPQDSWNCALCIDCQGCKAKLGPVNKYKDAIWTPTNLRICEDCNTRESIEDKVDVDAEV